MSDARMPASPAVDVADVDAWWTGLVTAALVGTARTAAPPLPGLGVLPRPGGGAETAVLDAAAVGAVLVRAGRPLPTAVDVPPGPGAPGSASAAPCPPDAAAPAPGRAVQLLRLALTQPPVSRDLQDDVVAAWLRAAATHGRRLPHELLPTALQAATTRTVLRDPLRAVLNERGRWLAARRTEWSWAVSTADASPAPVVDDDAWARATGPEQAALLRAIRASDPARGRDLAEQELASANAKQRAALVGALRVGLGPDDEDLLMTALADKASGVHRAASALLDAIPGSVRARRLGAVLAGAVSMHGLLRSTLRVAELSLPSDDVRTDSSTPEPGSAGWQPWLLEQVVAGAAAEALTDALGTDPAGVLRADRDRVLRPGLRRAALARRDAVWARALLTDGWDAELAAALPAAEREAVATAHLRSPDAGPAAGSTVAGVPVPWGEAFSDVVVAWCVRSTGTARRPAMLPLGADVLGGALHPGAAPAVRRALESAEQAEAAAARASAAAGPDAADVRAAAARLSITRHNVRVLRDVNQFLSFTHSIDEALR